MVNLEELHDRVAAVSPGNKMIMDPSEVDALINELHAARAGLRVVARSAVAAVEMSEQSISVARKPIENGRDTAIITFGDKRGPL